MVPAEDSCKDSIDKLQGFTPMESSEHCDCHADPEPKADHPQHDRNYGHYESLQDPLEDEGGSDSDSDSSCSSGSEEESDCEDLDEEEEAEKDEVIANCHKAPFWFSNEDPDHISCIIEHYSGALKLDEERRSCVRAPPPFIGRVKRVQVQNEMFTTLDQVSVYIRDYRPLGITLPFSRDVWFVTSWDVKEGIPLRCFEVEAGDLLKFWKARAVGRCSYLYCQPVDQTKEDWKYSVSPEKQPVLWASSLHTLTHYFNLYLPKALFAEPPRSPIADVDYI